MELRPLRSDDSRLGPPPFGRIVKFPLDLATPLDANTLHGLDGALAAHGLLVIEGQYDLGPVMEWSFISSFPWLDPENSASLTSADAAWWQFADCPMVRRLGDAVDEAGNLVGLLNRIGYEWHTDGSGATLLYCENAPESPPRTTLFASGAAAYGALPQDKRMEAEARLGVLLDPVRHWRHRDHRLRGGSADDAQRPAACAWPSLPGPMRFEAAAAKRRTIDPWCACTRRPQERCSGRRRRTWTICKSGDGCFR